MQGKVTNHYESSVSNQEAFEKDQKRLDAWATKNNIKLVDEPNSIVESMDRLNVIDKMKAFLKK